jgi:predicted nucleic acid-binding protein
MAHLDSLANVVRIIEFETFSKFEAIARQRLARRDENDWPILAAALALQCPIWTEDTDFFGAAWRPGPRTALNCICPKRYPDGAH